MSTLKQKTREYKPLVLSLAIVLMIAMVFFVNGHKTGEAKFYTTILMRNDFLALQSESGTYSVKITVQESTEQAMLIVDGVEYTVLSERTFKSPSTMINASSGPIDVTVYLEDAVTFKYEVQRNFDYKVDRIMVIILVGLFIAMWMFIIWMSTIKGKYG